MLLRTARRSPAGRSARRQPRRPASAHRRRCGGPALMEDPAGPGSTVLSPGGDGGGEAPVQLLPATAPIRRHRQRPLLLGQCRPSSSPWPATAGPAPPPTARCRAPGTAGRCGCRTAGRGCGTPGSASRRSAECTDGRRRASASKCRCGPCRSPSRARWRSPPAGASSGAPRGLTALAWLPGSDQPTEPAGTAKPEPHRASTVLPVLRYARENSEARRTWSSVGRTPV